MKGEHTFYMGRTFIQERSSPFQCHTYIVARLRVIADMYVVGSMSKIRLLSTSKLAISSMAFLCGMNGNLFDGEP